MAHQWKDQIAGNHAQVYFAGKVDNYRAQLFNDEQIMERGLCTIVNAVGGGQCAYGGPHALMRPKVAPDHSWLDKPHGIVGSKKTLGSETLKELWRQGSPLVDQLDDYEQGNYEHWAGWSVPVNVVAATISNEGSGGITAKGAVLRCFEQIEQADAVHAYIDTLDCPGTLAELGYASAKGKPIYIVISSSLQPKQVFQWFPISGNCGTGPCDSLWEASNELCGLETPMERRGSQFLYYINDKPLWMTRAEFKEWATEQHDKGYPDVRSVSSEPASPGHFYGFSISRLIRNAEKYSGDEYGQHSFSEREIISEYKFEQPEKDELWFIKNLPGVVHWQYGGPTDIHEDLLWFPPAPEPQPTSNKKAPPVPQKMRLEVLVRDGYRCQYCGAAAKDGATLEVDHIVPRAKGGENLLWNLQTLCFDCNRGKRDKILPPAPTD